MKLNMLLLIFKHFSPDIKFWPHHNNSIQNTHVAVLIMKLTEWQIYSWLCDYLVTRDNLAMFSLQTTYTCGKLALDLLPSDIQQSSLVPVKTKADENCAMLKWGSES